MDFTKLIQDDLTEEWVQKFFRKLEPYPYLADILIILLSFALGALLAALLFWILRRILHRFYRRHCEMNPALRDCIRRMLVHHMAGHQDPVSGAPGADLIAERGYETLCCMVKITPADR